ncbi:prefoldin subunit 4 isoform 2 [Rattus norvegicus]|nr:prefoldin subunit 4 isoform 2 [Rattus norvegicus]
MAATMKKAAAEDVNVTFEDQQKINKFARNTSRITELKEEIEVKKNLEDACDDVMLADDDCLMIPYQIGDVFISHSQEETQEMLEDAKKTLQEEIIALEFLSGVHPAGAGRPESAVVREVRQQT